MSIVIDSCEVIKDDWLRYDRQRPIGNSSRVVVVAADLAKYREFFKRAVFQLGVELEVTAEIDVIEEWLPRLDLVILNFESFADGRAFSQARILRERFGYRGDIRARGEVLRDQLPFMQRCGFNQFELSDSEDLSRVFDSFTEISGNYQPDLESGYGCTREPENQLRYAG